MILIAIIDKLFLIFTVMLFIRIIGSWLPDLQNTRFMQFIAFYTDPYLNLFRKFIPPLGMIDLSPIIAFICLGFIEEFFKYLILLFIR